MLQALIRKMRAMVKGLGFSDVALGSSAYLNYLYHEYQMAYKDGLTFLEIVDAFERVTLIYDYITLNNATARKEHARRHKVPMKKVQALYYPPSNRFDIGMFKLQFPVISHKLPSYFNYGRIGFTMGHEMMHAYDIKCMAFHLIY
ncbi:unnamed protein product [Cylicocyclus nassatus]|uniref:Peptidase M13 C-terminal domain-containing protein n=1 Tax=Cylicocyclus nassatus TaxID=53992 RepID=A0AA36H3I8_CYLNA|nr:unnamed protein product [Cylicocyclus nassatus]